MRMRRVALPLVFLATLAAAACGLPARDNPNEPGQRPIADLVVIDVPASPQGGCQVVGAWPDVDHVATTGAVQRGTCVGLDARRSRDPRGLPLTFTFQAPDGAVLASPTSGIGTISIDQLRALSIDSAHTFSVTVDNHANPPVIATADLIVQDAAPTVVVDEDRTLPTGGYPWALGSSFQISFHATGADPDYGDDAVLSYCWTVPPQPEQCGLSADIVRSIPTTPARYAVSARADDGARRSAPATELLRVSDPNLWGQTYSSRFQRMDSQRRRWSTSSSAIVGATLFDDGVSPLVAAVGFNSDSSVTTEVRQWPDLQPITGGAISQPYILDTVPTLDAKVAASPSQRLVWVSGLDEPANKKFRSTLFAYSVAANGTLSSAVPISTPFPPESSGLIEETLTRDLGAVDAAGNGWGARTFGFNVYAMTPQGTPYTMPVPNMGLAGLVAQVQALSARPQSSEVWTLARFQVPPVAQTPPSAPGFLWRLSGPGDTGVAFPLPDLVVGGLAFADHDRAWIYSADRGLVLVDITAIEGGADPTTSTLLVFPEVVLSEAADLTVDPLTGAARVRDDIAGVTWTAGLDGTLASTSGAATPQFVDALGRTWSLAGNFLATSLQGGDGTSADGALFRTTDVVPNASAYDWTTGGAWVPFYDSTSQNQLVAGFSRFDENGVGRRTFTTMSVAGVIRRPPAPPLDGVHVSADGKILWSIGTIIGGIQAGTANEIWAMDLSTDPPTGRLALANNARYRRAVTPLTSDPHKAWTIDLSFVNNVATTLTLLGDDGTDTPVFTVPLAEYNPGTTATVIPVGGVSRGSDKMCLATVDVGANTVHWRRISTAGVEEDLDTFTNAATYTYPLVSAAKGAVDDDCFFVLHDSTGSGTDYLYGMSGGAFTRYYSQSESPIVSLATPSPRVAFIALANGNHYRLSWATDTGSFSAPTVSLIGNSEVTDFATY